MRMLPGPSRPSAGRLGWWIVGCFLALVAAFWLTERAVDWLWMGTLGYRPVFWQIIDLRFALFAAAFVPLALVFWLNLRWALRLMEGWRQATGAQIDPALVQLERSALLRRALPALLAFIVAIGSPGSGTTRSASSTAGASGSRTRCSAATWVFTCFGCRWSRRSCARSSSSHCCCCSPRQGSWSDSGCSATGRGSTTRRAQRQRQRSAGTSPPSRLLRPPATSSIASACSTPRAAPSGARATWTCTW